VKKSKKALPAKKQMGDTELLVDPIFAAIEAHQRAVTVHKEAVGIEDNLGENLPEDRRRSDISAWKETIVETDDPRWLAAIRARSEASNTMDDLAIDMLNIEPTTVAGIEALLRYFADHDEPMFPDGVDDDDDGGSEIFGHSLVRHAADALRKIARAGQARGALI
jgi:hypothetical protein